MRKALWLVKVFVTAAYANAGEVDYSTLIFGFDGQCKEFSETDVVTYFDCKFEILESLKEAGRTTTLIARWLPTMMKVLPLKHSDTDISASSLLRREERGKMQKFDLHRRLLKDVHPLDREEMLLGTLYILGLKAAYGIRRAEEILKQLAEGEEQAESFASFVSLDTLGLIVAKNPVLGKKLKQYVDMLPCIQVKADGDYKLVSRSANSGTEPNISADDTLAPILPQSSVRPLNITLGDFRDSKQIAVLPNEPHLWLQWHLMGPSQGYPWGMDVINGYSNFFSDRIQKETLANGNTVTIVNLDDVKLEFPGRDIVVHDADFTAVDEVLPSLRWDETKTECSDKSLTLQEKFKRGCSGWQYGNSSPLSDVVVSWHGTSMAALIGSAWNNQGIMGASPGSRLIMVGSASKDGSNTWKTTVLSMEEAALRKSKLISFNMGSYGLTESGYHAFRRLSDLGFIIVVPAGDENCPTDIDLRDIYPCYFEGEVQYEPSTPGAYRVPGMIQVGSIDQLGRKSSFSNWGAEVDIWAPGARILTWSGRTSLKYYYGTSAASSLVAAVIGTVWGAYPSLTRDEIVSIVLDTSKYNRKLKLYGNPRVVDMNMALLKAKTQVQEKDIAKMDADIIKSNSEDLDQINSISLHKVNQFRAAMMP